MKHTTTRKSIPVRIGFDSEPMHAYGWRCGFYGLRPEVAKHATNPDFLRGLRSGRAQRQQPARPAAYRIIVGLPHLRQMRREIQGAFAEAAEAQRRLDSQYRAAARGFAHISNTGRDIGQVRQDAADRDAETVAALWETHGRLSAAYEAERARLLQLRGVKA